MFISKKDYQELLSDIEYRENRERIVGNYLIQEGKLREQMENEIKELGCHLYGKEFAKVLIKMYKENIEKEADE